MRVHRLSAVFTLLLLCGASSASAQGWGREWMERLSGPGPFKGDGFHFPVACHWKAKTGNGQNFVWSFNTPTDDKPGERLLCIDFQYTALTNGDSEDLGVITVKTYEGRVGFPLDRWEDKDKDYKSRWWLGAFEPSVSVGAIHFVGADFDEWRLTLSPEIVVKPLKFIPHSSARINTDRVNRKFDWRGVVEFAYGGVLITPKIDNEDLHVINREPFEHGWLKRAVFIRFNASELVGLR